MLMDWLADMRERTAWAQIRFALLGEDIELYGGKDRPMSVWSQKQRRASRYVHERLGFILTLGN